MEAETKKSNAGRYIIIGVFSAITVGTLALSIFLIFNWEYISRLESQGFLGLFLVSMIAGSPLPVLSPSMLVTFAMGSFLNPALVGIVSGLGNAVGTAFIYLTGRGGTSFFSDFDFSRSRLGKFFNRIRMPGKLSVAKYSAPVAVFLLSLYPNPALPAMVITMGATRYNFNRFFLACFAGKTVQALIIAYFGYFGLGSLLRYFGAFTVP